MNASSTELHRKIRRTAGRAPSEAAECGPAASKMRPKGAAGGEKFGSHQRPFGSVRGAKALAKGDLGLNFLARGILESAFL